MEVQTDEPSTRPKVHLYRDSDAQTDEPSTSTTSITSHAVDIASEVDEPSADLMPPVKRARHDYGAAAAAANHEDDDDVVDVPIPDQVYSVLSKTLGII